MKAAYLQESKETSLKDQIYQTIKNTKFQSVSNLLRKTRRREHSCHYVSSRHSYLKPSVDSLHVQTQLSGPQFSFSPPFNSSQKASAHRSTDYLHNKPTLRPGKNARNMISRGKKQQNFHLSQPKIGRKQKRGKSRSIRRHKTVRSDKSKEDRQSQSRSRNSGSRDKGSSRLKNLSEILEQESSQEKLITPSSKAGKSRYQQGRRFSGDRTKKKIRHGLKDIVWKRLERSLRQPQKFQRLLKNEIMSLRFRILRKSLLEVQIHVFKQVEKFNINLQKGNLECQGIQEFFPRLEANGVFSLYSSVRSIDLSEPLRLPRLIVEAIVNEDQKYEKFVTLPYCWIHLAQFSHLKHLSRSRIKTKACIEDLSCSKMSLKGLIGVLPGWSCQSTGKGSYVWQSKMTIFENQFQFRVIEKDGHYLGELSGRGEQRLTRMLEFLQELL